VPVPVPVGTYPRILVLMRAIAAGLYQLTYFPLWAKGPASALALSHSGLEWRGRFPDDWAALKPTTPWSKLPLLEVPGDPPLAIAHELAILSWIGRAVPKMGGATDIEWAASQQIMCECEDIYAKLTKFQPTTRQPVKCSAAELEALWSSSDHTVHNREQGLNVNLALLESFAQRAPSGSAGKLTRFGATTGECKLFSTLHALVMIEADVLYAYPQLDAFYNRFGALSPTRSVVDSGGQMPGSFDQYFVRAA
jgi:hypothetical protein